MKSKLFLKILTVFTSVILLTSVVYGASGDTIVHRTKTGECYHKAGCSYLKSDIEVTLSDAIELGLRPCSRCHPPTLDSVDTYVNGYSNYYSQSNNTKEANQTVTSAAKTSVKDGSSHTSPLVWIGVGAVGSYLVLKRKP